ncbi:MAG: DUF1289 domain-containing protein [Bdellovibrio sp.]|nr:MAG: DUF1289 domain-containing protein [Bdellovibrio sp.]
MFWKKSPCNGYCTFDESQRYCLGCLRTPQEIAKWKTDLSEEQKKSIWLSLSQRRFSVKFPTYVKDQMGEFIEIDKPINKIVSLVPSLTQTLHDLNKEDLLVGHTKFCPRKEKSSVALIGGTKNPDLEKIVSLKPDLVLAAKEENRKEDIEYLKQFFPVFVTDVLSLRDSFRLMNVLGDLLQCQNEAFNLNSKTYKKLHLLAGAGQGQTCLYLIWKNPYMAAAGETYIHSWLEHLGFENLLKEEKRYPALSLSDIVALKPQIIFLPDEPYKFTKENAKELKEALPQTELMFIEGKMFSWFGSYMLKAAEWLDLNFIKNNA